MKEKSQEKKQYKHGQKGADKLPTDKSKSCDKVVKSTTVNNRPYFKWKNTEVLGK